MRLLCCILLSLLVLPVSRAQYGYDTVKIYFPINVSTLDIKARQRLDSVARIAGNTRRMLIYGYADYLGQESANEVLARTRAQGVRQYLLSRKINAQQVPVCEGIAEVRRPAVPDEEGFPEDRRVAIFLQRSNRATPAPAKVSGIRVRELEPEISPGPPLRSGIPVKKSTLPASVPITVPPPALPGNKFERLADMEIGDVLRIQNIHFLPTRHMITKESEPILEELYYTLLRHPELRIRIEGHVCCIKADGDALDTDTRKFDLSESRARFIYDYLISRGILKDRLEYIGYGKRRPIIQLERTEEEAQMNRRVEFRVIGN